MPKSSPPTPAIASLMTKTVVNAAPTSTTNITGFFTTILGFSLRNDSLIARLRISESNSGRARTPREMSCGPSCFVSCLRSSGGAPRVDIFNSSFVISSEQLSVQHLEVFNNWAQRERREICERAYNQDGTD